MRPPSTKRLLRLKTETTMNKSRNGCVRLQERTSDDEFCAEEIRTLIHLKKPLVDKFNKNFTTANLGLEFKP